MSALLCSVLTTVVASDQPMADTKPTMLAMAIVCIASLSVAGFYGDIYNIAHTLSGSKVVALHAPTRFDLMHTLDVYQAAQLLLIWTYAIRCDGCGTIAPADFHSSCFVKRHSLVDLDLCAASSSDSALAESHRSCFVKRHSSC
eukprot:4073705-Amphidinium_carterae.1